MTTLTGGYVVLASCLGATGGGLVAFDGHRVERLDRLSCTGLALAGTRLARLLYTGADPGQAAEILVYDAVGVERYYRLDGILDPHDLAWSGRDFIVVSDVHEQHRVGRAIR